MKGFRKALQLLLLAEIATAFLPGTRTTTRTTTSTSTSTSTTTHLRAHISEWRDLMFENVPKELVGDVNEGEPVREVCILPFPLTDVLLQGETKELCLYEDRFHKLFEKATTDHAGIVAMGFIAPPSGMLQGMPLCEIENFRTMEGDTGFGNMSILATIRVVGRATLLDVQTAHEDDEADMDSLADAYMTGWCQELIDDTKNNSDEDMMEVYNELADDCDELFESVVGLKDKIESLEEKQQKKSGVGGDSEVLSEATLRRMKLEAELGLDDDDDDDDDDDYWEGNDEVTGPRSTLQEAIQVAKASDSQGYTILSTGSDSGQSSTKTKTTRSIQDLTALSWAYLSKDVWGEEDDDEKNLLKYRLQALNTVDLTDRFILVSKMLTVQKNALTEKLDKL